MHKYILLMGLLLLTYYTKAQQNKAARIDSVMQVAYQRGVFNGNILVAQKGKIIYEKAWGYADGSRNKLLTTDMRFDIGSISKEFNGTAIMLLKEKGELNLDDPISKFMPSMPPWAQQVKIKHLINYTSGIPLFDATSSESDSEILANLMTLKALSFEPGSAYIYNHYNVYLQERIIERVSGLPYADFVKQYILTPCGMNNTIINYPPNAAGMARAFNNEFVETPYAQAMTGWVRLPIADLYKWTANLHNYKVISKASFKELAANFSGGESSLGSVGFENEELAWHQHQGSNSNYEALFYSNVKEGTTIVMMTNSQQMKVHGIKGAILAVLKNETVTVPKKSVYLEIREKVLANPDSGLTLYRKLKATGQDQYDFSFEIGDLISTGKYLERRSHFDDAVKVFTIAVALKGKPADIAYGYELMGQCYFKKGDKREAIKYYTKALQTDPANKNVEGMLSTLMK